MVGVAFVRWGGILAAMNASLEKTVGTLLVCLVVAMLPAQERAAKQPLGGPIVVKITTLLSGRVVEVEHPTTKKKARRTVDRKLQWTVGNKTYTTFKAAAEALNNLAADPASLRPDPSTGGRKLAGLRVAPGPNVQWAEVLQLWDASTSAGWYSFALEGVGTEFLMPKAIANPVVHQADLIVPHCIYCEPDESPPKLRPTIDVHRNGHVVSDGRRVFAWRAGQVENLGPMRTELRALRAKMEKAGKLRARPQADGKWVDMRLLIRADGEASWRDVLRLLRELTKPDVGFWKLDLAVSEVPSRLR